MRKSHLVFESRALFVLALSASILMLAGCERAAAGGNEDNAAPAIAAGLANAVPEEVVVYYFHPTRRCRTCLGIQATIERTIKDRFAAETSAGVLSFREINIDLPENELLVKRHNVAFSSMVVAAMKGTAPVKWELCENTWDHAHDEPALADYAEQRIRAHLGLLPTS